MASSAIKIRAGWLGSWDWAGLIWLNDWVWSQSNQGWPQSHICKTNPLKWTQQRPC